MMAVDLEKCLEEKAATPAFDHDLPHAVHGYPKLAGRLNVRPETAAFRRFSELNIKSLLYMQAELIGLENQLWDLEIEDAQRLGDRNKCSRDFDALVALHEKGDTEQLRLIEKIQEKLKKYNKALIQTYTMLSYNAPDNSDLNDLQRGMEYQTPKEFYIKGLDQMTWGPRIQENAFSYWVARNGVKLLKYDLKKWFTFQCFSGPKKDRSKRVYYDSDVLKWTFLTTGVFVSLLPVASITVLLHFKKHGEWVQLGIIAGSNVLIAVFLTVLADAKRTDCFLVTTAFTVIQVLILSMDGNDCKGAVAL